MQRCLRLFSPKFLPNRDRVMFKNGKEAFYDYCRVAGTAFLVQLGLAALVVEFGLPTPDIAYDLKRLLSTDFDLYCRYGEKSEFRLDLSNQLVSFKKEEDLHKRSRALQPSPEARFGGTI